MLTTGVVAQPNDAYGVAATVAASGAARYIPFDISVSGATVRPIRRYTGEVDWAWLKEGEYDA
jgi:hypothetical protein